MFKIVIYSCLLFSSIYRYNGCAADPDVIVWSENRVLKWADFKEHEFHGFNVAALSSVKLKVDYKIKQYLKSFTVRCLFYKNESFAKDKTDWMLRHEQGHFDIGEIIARKLRKKIISIKDQIDEYNFDKLELIFRNFRDSLMLKQVLYDRETDHSNDTLQQERWSKEINYELNQLIQYK